jgi:hypothetical protein
MITLKNDEFNKTITNPTGFSWTSLFFGLIPIPLRGNLKLTLISFGAAFISAGISWFIMPFFIKKLHIKDLINNGYIPNSIEDGNLLKELEISVKKSL